MSNTNTKIISKTLNVFSVFIPKEEIDSDKCILPKIFLEQLVKQSEFYQSKGATYNLASDNNSMTLEQWQNLEKICEELKINLVDISKLPNYLGAWVNVNDKDQSQKKQFEKSMNKPFGCYIDYVKLMLINLSGRKVNGEPPRGKPRGITSGYSRVQSAIAQISLDLSGLHPQGKPCGFAVAV